MFNVKAEVKGDKLFIEVDLKKSEGLSSTGKSDIIASTHGNTSIGDMKLGLNLYRPVKTVKV